MDTVTDLRHLHNIPQFLSPKDCDHIQEYIHHIEKDILTGTQQNDNDYTGLTNRHGTYNFFEQVDTDLNIPLPTLIRDFVYDYFHKIVDTDEIWVKSWANKLYQGEHLPTHYHGVDHETDTDHFISGNIFLSNNNQSNPWYTYYESYGNIINEQGTLSIISSYLEHGVPQNHLEQPRYSCAFDVWFTPPQDLETEFFTYWNKHETFDKAYFISERPTS